MEQISIMDLDRKEALSSLPGRFAYIDECGNFGFDFDKEGTSLNYILCAVVVKSSDLPMLYAQVSKVKNENGFQTTEMKSSAIGNNHKRRNKILSELLQIKFHVILLIADKRRFVEESPLSTYRQSFIKYLHQRLYSTLYTTYPKLKIIEDQIGSSDFQSSFKQYVREHRPPNLFNEYDFDYVDSRDELFVQPADIIGGSISKSLTVADAPNYLEMLKGKILSTIDFPDTKGPYWGSASEEDRRFDKEVYELAVHRARLFISEHEKELEGEKHLQVAALRYLLFYVQNVNAQTFVSSRQLLSVLEECAEKKVRLNYLYRRIIAPLRDAGVILSSCSQGYKIPISVEDITTYINQTHTVVSPMLHRIEICRYLIKQQTSNDLDVLADPAFLKYKKYFD
jgi:hypothetical protein